MEVLQVAGLAKAFGAVNLFTDISFELRRGEKVGLIGANGAGKTTLVRCILGREPFDGGQISLSKGATTGYVEQDFGLGHVQAPEAETAVTLYDELCSAYQDVLLWQEDMRRLEKVIATEDDEGCLQAVLAEYAEITAKFEQSGGYEYESQVKKVAFGLGFTAEDLGRRPAEFSGGQKTRIGLARALIRRPDFLFLDEPTNHLDIAMVEWLEEFLQEYPGAVLMISHDRYFLDKAVARILAVEDGKIAQYQGGYSDYLVQKEERQEALSRAVAKQQAYIAKTEEYIRTYKAGIKSKQARGRQSILSRVERLAMPQESAGFDFFQFNPPLECAERVAVLEDVVAGYDSAQPILRGTSLLVRRGEGVALVGANGAGKTTLLKALLGELTPAAGKVKLGSRVQLGYFAQEHEGLNPKNRVLDELMQEYAFSEERSRHYLGAFLFRGDEVYKLISDLSGGEKARLALLKLMLTGANFLILDEPTNHLDIAAREAVEEAIMQFPGTFLTVSHDRYFLDKVAERVVEIVDGRLTEYLGNYTYYRERKAQLEKAAQRKTQQEAEAAAKAAREKAGKSAGRGTAVAEAAKKNNNSISSNSGRNSSPLRAKQEREKTVARLEKEIAVLEVELKQREAELNDPASHADPLVSRTLATEYAAMQAELEEKYSMWLELTSAD